MSDKPAFSPIGDVATHFCVSVSTIRAWIRDGRIPASTYIKVGTTYRFKISAIETALTADGGLELSPQMEMDFDEDEAKAPIAVYPTTD